MIASLCADSFGAVSASSFCIVSFVFDALRLKNTFDTRVSSLPVRSIATIVFSNVGAVELCASAWTSLRCSTMPASNAGVKSASLILSNGGM